MSDYKSEIRAAIDQFDMDTAQQLLAIALKNPDAEIFYLASLLSLDPLQKNQYLQEAISLDPSYRAIQFVSQELEQVVDVKLRALPKSSPENNPYSEEMISPLGSPALVRIEEPTIPLASTSTDSSRQIDVLKSSPLEAPKSSINQTSQAEKVSFRQLIGRSIRNSQYLTGFPLIFFLGLIAAGAVFVALNNHNNSQVSTPTFRPRPTVTSLSTTNTVPHISSVTTSGTCSGFQFNVIVMDGNNDLQRLELLASDGRSIDTLNVSPSSGTYQWPDWECNRERCTGRLVAVDSRNNRSNVYESSITCSTSSATPIPIIPPEIIGITYDGTCANFSWSINATDANQDIRQIQRLDRNGNIASTLDVNGSGTFRWTNWGCQSNRCTDRFRAVDARGNLSNIYEASIICYTITATPTTRSGIVIANGTINVRSGPGTNFPDVGDLQPGASVTILDTSDNGNWYQIRYGTGEAWVRRDLIRMNE